MRSIVVGTEEDSGNTLSRLVKLDAKQRSDQQRIGCRTYPNPAAAGRLQLLSSDKSPAGLPTSSRDHKNVIFITVKSEGFSVEKASGQNTKRC